MARIPNTQTGTLAGTQRGTNDTLTGGNHGRSFLYGDAALMLDSSKGGNDILTGSNGASNELFGDADDMYHNSKGGNDTLTGGNGASNNLRGDAALMRDSSKGGNDILTGGSNGASNHLFGDAEVMRDSSKGGNDILTGGSNNGAYNYLIGDAAVMRDSSKGGNDRLISGTGTDNMWGDAQHKDASVTTGADTFVFMTGSWNDTIWDFEHGKDHIDVSGYGYDEFSDLAITDNGFYTTIDFGPGNSVKLIGIDDSSILTATDFIFS